MKSASSSSRNPSSVREVTLLSLFLLSFVLGLVLYLNVWPSGATTIALLACMAYVVYGLVLLKLEPLFFLLIFLFYFGQLSAIISNVYIETGVYIAEQAQFSYATGATARLVMYDMVFLATALLLFRGLVSTSYLKNLVYRSWPFNPVWRYAIFAGCVVTLAILSVGLILYGSPLLLSTDRFAYWNSHPLPILRYLAGQLFILSFLIGALFAQGTKRADKVVPLTLFLGIIVCQVLQGDKFSGLFLNSYLFILPTLLNAAARTRARPSLAKIGLVALPVVFVFIVLISYHYAYINVGEGRGVGDQFQQRFTLQGHVWWGTDRLLSEEVSITDPRAQLAKEVRAWVSLNQPSDYLGLQFLMTLIAPWSTVERYFDQGVYFTMGYPAIGLYLFGYWGLVIVQIVAAFITVMSIKYLMFSILRSRLILSIIALKIFFDAYVAFTTGILHQLFSLEVATYILIALLLARVRIVGRSISWSQSRKAADKLAAN